ncbi:MAG: hypothetical protein M0Z87_11375 [Actinomycetota bacterium]|nr:hypothetical protein [Actinomycetota bacterium]
MTTDEPLHDTFRRWSDWQSPRGGPRRARSDAPAARDSRMEQVRGWVAPVAIGGIVASSAVSALFWVAPRVPIPSSSAPTPSSTSDAAAVAAAAADLSRLNRAVAAENAQIAQLASLPVPQPSAAGSSTVSLPALSAVPSIGSMSIPSGPPPAVQATTGASGVP